MTEFIDAYRVLGVGPDASHAQLKQAHRRLVRRHHPDLQPPDARQAATARTQEVNVAYGLVRDPQARAAYDRLHRRMRRGRLGDMDAEAAAVWERIATDAGRWAGRWWRRRRGRLMRQAMRARTAALDVAGRVRWLATCAAWTLGGLVAALLVQEFRGVDGPVALLVGGLGGLHVGNRRGWRARLRLAGADVRPSTPAGTAAVLGAAMAALMVGAWLDGRLG